MVENALRRIGLALKGGCNALTESGQNGNFQVSNLFAVIQYLQEQEGIHLEVKAWKVA